MPTITLETQLTPAMLSQAVRAMSETELEELERSLRDERLRRFSSDVPDDEAALLEAVLQPMPNQARWDELRQLRENDDWNESLNAEMLRLNEDREGANVRRVAAAMRLASLRGVPFQSLWKDLVGSPSQTRISNL